MDYSTINFTLKGNVPSKKNSRNIVCFGRRPVSLPNNRYKEWHEEAEYQIVKQLENMTFETIKLCKQLAVVFYVNSRRKFDLSNKFESVADLLVDCKVLEDDNVYVVPDVRIIFGGVDKENPRAEIIIEL